MSAMTFNGSSWSAPATIATARRRLRTGSVSCVSASFCIAVDAYGNAVTFNGSSWSAPVTIDGTAALDLGVVRVGVVLRRRGRQTGARRPSTAARGAHPRTSTARLSYLGVVPVGVVLRRRGRRRARGDFQRQLVERARHHRRHERPLLGVVRVGVVLRRRGRRQGNALTFDGSSWSVPVAVDGKRSYLGVVPVGVVLRRRGRVGWVLTFRLARRQHRRHEPLLARCRARRRRSASPWTRRAGLHVQRQLVGGAGRAGRRRRLGVVRVGVVLRRGGPDRARVDVQWPLVERAHHHRRTSGLTSVSCPSASFCAAVDSTGAR